MYEVVISSNYACLRIHIPREEYLAVLAGHTISFNQRQKNEATNTFLLLNSLPDITAQRSCKTLHTLYTCAWFTVLPCHIRGYIQSDGMLQWYIVVNIQQIYIYIILFIVIFQPMVYGSQFSFESHNLHVRFFTGITIKSNISIEAIGKVIEEQVYIFNISN